MAAGVAAGTLPAQSGSANRTEVPTRKAKVTKVFKGPDEHPNALEATKDALWIGGQVTEKAYKVDWKTGKLLHSVQTDSHNTSGMAVGGGYLWMSANGGTSNRRPPRPTDTPDDEIVQADLETGKTIYRYRPPWPGGSHGIAWADDTQTLWVTALGVRAIAQLDTKDKFRVLHMIPLQLDRAHGIDFDYKGNIYVMYSSDYLVHKLDMKTGKVLEVITFNKGEDPDPHGMCLHEGALYYCDAGFPVGSNVSNDPWSGWICKIDL
jgi:sugar lactone lactonase YvrE